MNSCSRLLSCYTGRCPASSLAFHPVTVVTQWRICHLENPWRASKLGLLLFGSSHTNILRESQTTYSSLKSCLFYFLRFFLKLWISFIKFMKFQTPQFLIYFLATARSNSVFNNVPFLCKFLSLFHAVSDDGFFHFVLFLTSI